MLLVRKTLTEILLEVTDEIIHEISSETLSKYRKKGICAIIVKQNSYYFSFPKIQNLNENCDKRRKKLFVIKRTQSFLLRLEEIWRCERIQPNKKNCYFFINLLNPKLKLLQWPQIELWRIRSVSNFSPSLCYPSSFWLLCPNWL